MLQLVEKKDWSTTPLGPIAEWPQTLKTSVQLCLRSKFPSVIFWGDDRIQIYNDGYRLILGPRHPLALGQSAAACWAEVWPRIKLMMEEVCQNKDAVWVENSLFPLERNGYVEEAYFTFSFTPIVDETGRVAGIFQTVSEVTQQILSYRRLALLRALGDQPTIHSLEEVCKIIISTLTPYATDLPFALIYLLDSSGKIAKLGGQVGLATAHPAYLASIVFEENDPWCMKQAIHNKSIVLLHDIEERFAAAFLGKPWDENVKTAVVLPIMVPGGEVIGIFISGLSSRLVFNKPYADFIQLLIQQLSRSFSVALIYEQERQKVQELAELDRVKTAFFHNISHEFRTPLTLILGPIQDAMTGTAPLLEGEELETVNRNALRLLRLVNNLLDFARLESNAGALRFAPVNLAELTMHIASSFRSLIERAGLRFEVNCPNESEFIYVDPSKWEMIVLNLLSNAFKFTLRGDISVRLESFSDHVELLIQDTGCGIPEAEQANIFKRFHRIHQTRGRSFEGSGIGLSLVQELINKQGGEIRFSSVENQGTQFIVSLPKGKAHLPVDCLIDNKQFDYKNDKVEKYIQELSQGQSHSEPTQKSNSPDTQNAKEVDFSAELLIVDDNADMLNYLENILSKFWKVRSACNGEIALKSALAFPPDLILSDIMMPVMNGVELLQKVRIDKRTREIPFIFLSARAGEEASLDGIEMGADDYLIKPFSARELKTRVKTHLNISRLRKQWSRELVSLNKELEAFSYSVSHDLRAPLRAIDGFSKVILQDYSESLPTEAQHYFKRIRSATVRMGGLIDDLINLSRITQTSIKRTKVNVSALAKNILGELAVKDSPRKVRLTVEENIFADIDPHLFEILLQNLLSNAWKFTSKIKDAHIKVGRIVSKEKNQSIYFITDNGAGFDMKRADRIFTPFQRFHSNSEFEGTGIGLAIVSRIIKKHNGHIWVATKPGAGATFSFTVGESDAK